MSTNGFSTVGDQFTQHRADFRQEWLNDVMLVWNRHYPGLVNEDELRQHAGRLLDEMVIAFAAQLGDTTPDSASDGKVAGAAHVFRDRRAKVGFKPEDTVKYTLAMKNVLIGRLLSELSQSSSDWIECLARIEGMLERNPLLTFEAFQQSLMPKELESPIIRLWDWLLMLPMFGVVNTHREHQVAECLLQDITRNKAKVTLIDVTGVPTFNANAVQYIIKMVDLAQNLGSRIVITGISAVDRLTLTHAGAGLAGVSTCATMRAGIVEAFRIASLGTLVAESAGVN